MTPPQHPRPNNHNTHKLNFTNIHKAKAAMANWMEIAREIQQRDPSKRWLQILLYSKPLYPLMPIPTHMPTPTYGFPIPFPSDPRLPLGTWVETQHHNERPKSDDYQHFKEQGIIIGYLFSHPVWTPPGYVQALKTADNQAPQGWAYEVLIFRRWNDNQPCWSMGRPQVEAILATDITPIDPVQAFIVLEPDAIAAMFWGGVLEVLEQKGAQVRIHSTPYRLELTAPNDHAADRLWKLKTDIAQVANIYHFPPNIFIRTPGECSYSFTADPTPSFKLGNQHISLKMPITTTPQTSTDQDLRTLERLFASPNVAAITAHDTNTCLLITPGGSDQLIWQAPQYSGYNWLWSWRDSMDDYQRLRQTLKQEGKAHGFVYRFRDVNSDLTEYISNFEMVESFQGVLCRTCFDLESKLIESARPTPTR
ncbi:MAG: hypothetical protein F6J87_19675 [Spirulina sp. SIO3F2]|nr:hypothetical protein [Spirulina sp. SIO3F2]